MSFKVVFWCMNNGSAATLWKNKPFRSLTALSNEEEVVEKVRTEEEGEEGWECPKRARATKANFVETSEEMLLMAYVDDTDAGRDYLWFLNSGCSNHMCGKRELFSMFDNNFRETVKLGNDTSPTVLGKGNIRMEMNGIVHVITEVFFVPELKNNLLSIGQFQEKGLAVVMQHKKMQDLPS
ncbi:uncharacterized protein [Malus domestica]|uniref:uncharacterized protein n=1 Tax=Malus domestica TaxID=3750 RepID=UPI003975B7CB